MRILVIKLLIITLFVTVLIVMTSIAVLLFPRKCPPRFLDFRATAQDKFVNIDVSHPASWGFCCGYRHKLKENTMRLYPYVSLFPIPFSTFKTININVSNGDVHDIRIVYKEGIEETIWTDDRHN